MGISTFNELSLFRILHNIYTEYGTSKQQDKLLPFHQNNTLFTVGALKFTSC